jgi:hypothetical protein
MTAQQRIIRVRRSYNQWVANETLEDYALRFTAKSARKWSPFRVANTALGAISFLALEAIGGSITLSYGFTNAVVAILVVGCIIFATGLPIAYYAAKYGVDIDLLTAAPASATSAPRSPRSSTPPSRSCSSPWKRRSCRWRSRCASACRWRSATC